MLFNIDVTAGYSLSLKLVQIRAMEADLEVERARVNPPALDSGADGGGSDGGGADGRGADGAHGAADGADGTNGDADDNHE